MKALLVLLCFCGAVCAAEVGEEFELLKNKFADDWRTLMEAQRNAGTRVSEAYLAAMDVVGKTLAKDQRNKELKALGTERETLKNEALTKNWPRDLPFSLSAARTTAINGLA